VTISLEVSNEIYLPNHPLHLHQLIIF